MHSALEPDGGSDASDRNLLGAVIDEPRDAGGKIIVYFEVVGRLPRVPRAAGHAGTRDLLFVVRFGQRARLDLSACHGRTSIAIGVNLAARRLRAYVCSSMNASPRVARGLVCMRRPSSA